MNTRKAFFEERNASILRLLKLGLTNQQIALELSIPLDTVKYSMTRLNRKHGVTSRTQMILKLHGRIT